MKTYTEIGSYDSIILPHESIEESVRTMSNGMFADEQINDAIQRYRGLIKEIIYEMYGDSVYMAGDQFFAEVGVDGAVRSVVRDIIKNIELQAIFESRNPLVR